MTLQIKQATKTDAKLRLDLNGAPGSGKTFTALAIAENLGDKILVVDTEHGSASKYADIFKFDVIELDDFHPNHFIEALRLAAANDYEVVILDSLSHAWNGKGGVLDLHGDAEKRVRNSFAAWKEVTPIQNKLIEAIVGAKTHVIATMRTKTDYSMDKDEKGKTAVKNVGLAPIQRDGMEYEFDVVAQLDADNNFIVQKSRCPQLSGKVFSKAGIEVAEILKVWLTGEKPIKVKNNVAGDSAPVSPETRGRLLKEGGFVSRTAKGYEITDTATGAIQTVTKTNGIVECDCEDYQNNIADIENYLCAHKWACKFFAEQK